MRRASTGRREDRATRRLRALAAVAACAAVLLALAHRRSARALVRLRQDDARLERRLRRARAELFHLRLLLERGEPAGVDAALAAVEAALDELPSVY